MGSEAVWLSPVGKKRNTGRGKCVPRALVSSSICLQFYLFVNPNDQNLMHVTWKNTISMSLFYYKVAAFYSDLFGG